MHNSINKQPVNREKDILGSVTAELSIREQAIITNKPQGLTEVVVCFMHEQLDKNPKIRSATKITLKYSSTKKNVFFFCNEYFKTDFFIWCKDLSQDHPETKNKLGLFVLIGNTFEKHPF